MAPPKGVTFPRGLVHFTAYTCWTLEAGAPATVRFPAGLPSGAKLWMFGPTSDQPASHWHVVDATVGDGVATFSMRQSELIRVDDRDLGESTHGIVAIGLGEPGQLASYQDLWWSGPAESGWGMSVTQHGDTIFAVIYAYGADGNPTWFVMPGGRWNAAHSEYSGAIYSPRGTPWSAYDASKLQVGAPVGNATLTFAGVLQAQLDYTANGVAKTKAMTRQLFGPVDHAALPSYGDMWWGGPSQNGWGFAVLQQYSTLFSLWFTYDEGGAPTWFAMPGGSWIAKDVYEGRVYRTAGTPFFMPYDSKRYSPRDAGGFRLDFGAQPPTFEYRIDGRPGTLPLSRQPF
jgi:hypothetical protein